MPEKPGVIRVAFDSLGCKLNRAEVEQLARQFRRAGYRVVAPGEGADVYILNTCTLTHVADRKSRHLLRLAHRRHPEARLVVTGCYAERARRELEKIDGVALVVGNDGKPELLKVLEESGILKRSGADLSGEAPYPSGRTRSFIRIQDGCASFCAYCIVPLVRRRLESVPEERVFSRVSDLASEGCREVVLTGTEVGTYRSGGTGLKELLEGLLAETRLPRIRLSSLQPPEITPGLVGLWRDARLCPHFHLSLQSGSDGVLRRMKRRYDVEDYRRAVSLIRNTVPDVAVTTDVIVGFPGETDAEFREGLEFCREMRFSRVHVFPYSPRPGTAAAKMPEQVSQQTKKQRLEQLLSLAEASRREFSRRFAGREMMVLWEQRSGGIWSGYTGNYIRVYARNSADLANELLPARIGDVYRDGVWGELI